MTENVLITGGSGLVGTALTKLLMENNYAVSHVTRKKKNRTDITEYEWDHLDETALQTVDYIIHLSGSGVADKRWNAEVKKEILESRVDTAHQIYHKLSKINHKVKAFISMSGVGYYGYDNGDIWQKENSRFGDDFLATVVKEWEKAADQFSESGIRVVKMRTGIVLSNRGGALKSLTTPIRYGIGAALGNGKQYMSWIHIEDLCRAFIFAIQTPKMEGAYNLCTAEPVSNKHMTQVIAKILRKPLILPGVPLFVLKILLGEFASSLVGSIRASAEKLQGEGFVFSYPELPQALSHLLKSQSE
ncbi:MAG: TIGR01777 family oxidoreductase [Cyclobacteriaceae bacterium]|nr:TIGR01777 family oxidoreductase [Cyclobacteriaceae bacterium]